VTVTMLRYAVPGYSLPRTRPSA